MAVPSPATAPTARQLVLTIRRRGGRIYRMPQTLVFCITNEPALAEWLLELGGKAYLPAHTTPGSMVGGYKRAADGPLEWDIYIHTIPVSGEKTIWEAAAGKSIEWEFGDSTEAVA